MSERTNARSEQSPPGPPIDEAVRLPPEGHAVVVAGPGTGKTRRIGERIDYLTNDLQVLASEILLLTLTRETVRSLRARIKAPAASTFHSFALAELNRIGDAARKRIADKWETRHLIAEDMKMLSERNGLKIRVDAVPDFLRKLGAGFRTTQTDDPVLTDEERLLRTAWYRVRDFCSLRLLDELAYDLVGHLKSGWKLPRPPVAMLVDEYQDLTPVELELLRLISTVHGAGVFACGDDRQSIFGFRDADPLSLNNFGKVYEVEPAYLWMSFRCPRRVLALAEEVARRMPAIRGLTERPALISDESCGAGSVRVATFRSPQAEALWVVRRIAALHRPTDVPETDERVAVIAPRDVDVYVDELNSASEKLGVGLAFRDAREQDPFVDDTAFRAAYASLRLAEDEDDYLAWRTVFALADGVGPKTIGELYLAGERLGPAFRANAATNKRLRTLRDTVMIAHDRLRMADSTDSIWTVLDEFVGFLCSDRKASEWREKVSAVDLDYERESPLADVLARFTEAVYTTVADAKIKPNEVLIYTVFGSKGQQWPHVVIVGAYSQGFQDDRPADGLRRLYVVLTRSMRSLTVTMPRWVRYTPLANRLPTYAPSFTPDFREAVAACEIPIESDPDNPTVP